MPYTHEDTYTIWQGIRKRCLNKNNRSYHHYGGRGIAICKRWDSYIQFKADMGERPEGYSVERLDVDGDYTPENCIWANSQVQSINRRVTRPRGSFGVKKYGRYKFCSTLSFDSKRFYSPPVATREEAAWMYDQWAIAFYGDEASLNYDYV